MNTSIPLLNILWESEIPFYFYLRWSGILIALAHTLIALAHLNSTERCTGCRGIHEKGSGDVVSAVRYTIYSIHYLSIPLHTNSWDDISRTLFVIFPVPLIFIMNNMFLSEDPAVLVPVVPPVLRLTGTKRQPNIGNKNMEYSPFYNSPPIT